MNVPPLVEADISVVVFVHVVEELGQFAARHSQAGGSEGGLELLHVEFPVAILVYGLEQEQELSLGPFDERAEL